MYHVQHFHKNVLCPLLRKATATKSIYIKNKKVKLRRKDSLLWMSYPLRNGSNLDKPHQQQTLCRHMTNGVSNKEGKKCDMAMSTLLACCVRKKN